ncbi:MAG: hypothetical protein ACI4MJ_06570 [Aristaeellaceae bacterium]
MKYAGRIVLGLCFALLLLLGARTLVEGPQETAHALPCLPEGSLVALEAQTVQQGATAQEDTRPTFRERAARQELQAQGPALLPVRDRNGRPMASRTYARTAYTVCPMEDMPG